MPSDNQELKGRLLRYLDSLCLIFGSQICILTSTLGDPELGGWCTMLWEAHIQVSDDSFVLIGPFNKPIYGNNNQSNFKWVLFKIFILTLGEITYIFLLQEDGYLDFG